MFGYSECEWSHGVAETCNHLFAHDKVYDFTIESFGFGRLIRYFVSDFSEMFGLQNPLTGLLKICKVSVNQVYT